VPFVSGTISLSGTDKDAAEAFHEFLTSLTTADVDPNPFRDTKNHLAFNVQSVGGGSGIARYFSFGLAGRPTVTAHFAFHQDGKLIIKQTMKSSSVTLDRRDAGFWGRFFGGSNRSFVRTTCRKITCQVVADVLTALETPVSQQKEYTTAIEEKGYPKFFYQSYVFSLLLPLQPIAFVLSILGLRDSISKKQGIKWSIFSVVWSTLSLCLFLWWFLYIICFGNGDGDGDGKKHVAIASSHGMQQQEGTSNKDSDPNRAASELFAQAEDLEKQGKNAEAIALYARIIESHLQPIDLAYGRRGRANLNQGQLDKAEADLNEAIRINPSCYGVYFSRGQVFQERKQFDKAIADFTRDLSLEKDEEGIAITRKVRGMCFLEQKLPNKAVDDFNELVRLRPNLDEAYFCRGVAQRDRNKLDEAVADFSKAISLATNQKSKCVVLVSRGVTYYRQDRFEEALGDFSAIIAAEPKDAKAYFFRSKVYDAMSRQAEATADLKKAKELDPDVDK